MSSMQEQAINTFEEGLVMDLNPLTTPNNVLTNCLNGTMITYNGNEFVLQNDMGNGRVESAYLPSGYVPIGIKEHGGIVYIASYNPITNKGQIGSFPSPERNLDSDEISSKQYNIGWEDFAYGEAGDPENIDDKYKYSHVKEFKTVQEIMDTSKLLPGDKFLIYTSSNRSNQEELLSDLNTWVTNFGVLNSENNSYNYDSNKNNPITLNVQIKASDGVFHNITDSILKISQGGASDNNYEYIFSTSEGDLNKPETVEQTRKLNNKLNTYNERFSGKLCIVATLPTITSSSITYSGRHETITEENDEIKVTKIDIINMYEYTEPNAATFFRGGRIGFKYTEDEKTVELNNKKSVKLKLNDEKTLNLQPDIFSYIDISDIIGPSKNIKQEALKDLILYTQTGVLTIELLPYMEFSEGVRGYMKIYNKESIINISEIYSGTATVTKWAFYNNLTSEYVNLLLGIEVFNSNIRKYTSIDLIYDSESIQSIDGQLSGLFEIPITYETLGSEKDKIVDIYIRFNYTEEAEGKSISNYIEDKHSLLLTPMFNKFYPNGITDIDKTNMEARAYKHNLDSDDIEASFFDTYIQEESESMFILGDPIDHTLNIAENAPGVEYPSTPTEENYSGTFKYNESYIYPIKEKELINPNDYPYNIDDIQIEFDKGITLNYISGEDPSYKITPSITSNNNIKLDISHTITLTGENPKKVYPLNPHRYFVENLHGRIDDANYSMYCIGVMGHTRRQNLAMSASLTVKNEVISKVSNIYTLRRLSLNSSSFIGLRSNWSSDPNTNGDMNFIKIYDQDKIPSSIEAIMRLDNIFNPTSNELYILFGGFVIPRDGDDKAARFDQCNSLLIQKINKAHRDTSGFNPNYKDNGSWDTLSGTKAYPTATLLYNNVDMGLIILNSIYKCKNILNIDNEISGGSANHSLYERYDFSLQDTDKNPKILTKDLIPTNSNKESLMPNVLNPSGLKFGSVKDILGYLYDICYLKQSDTPQYIFDNIQSNAKSHNVHYNLSIPVKFKKSNTKFEKIPNIKHNITKVTITSDSNLVLKQNVPDKVYKVFDLKYSFEVNGNIEDLNTNKLYVLDSDNILHIRIPDNYTNILNVMTYNPNTRKIKFTNATMGESVTNSTVNLVHDSRFFGIGSTHSNEESRSINFKRLGLNTYTEELQLDSNLSRIKIS